MGETLFQFLFKYPAVAFERGRMAFASGWPGWLLALLIVAAFAGIGWHLRRSKPQLSKAALGFVWMAQALTISILIVLLWRPALILSTLVPQRNVIGVLVDDSASMALPDGERTRIERVREALGESSPLLSELGENFQVRTFSFSDQPRRLQSMEDLTAQGASSRLEDSIAGVYSELRHLPLAGLVVVTDGAQNIASTTGGDMQEILARKIPIYTLGIGETENSRDIQIDELSLPRTALPDSMISGGVTIRQRGYIGRKAKLEVREGNRLLKSQEIEFGPAPIETVTLNFTPQTIGIREYTVSIYSDSLEEFNTRNNFQSRVVEVREQAAKILYIEGEPRWEYKFIRRAVELDSSLQVASILRTSENKFYRQGIENAAELAEGLPEQKELFEYDGLIIGSLNAAFFSPQQQREIFEFVSRRGGGLLFLGGRYALGEGGYQTSNLADLIPVDLIPAHGMTKLNRARAQFQPTARGAERIQLSDDETLNRENWAALPALGTYQETGEPKPGAVVLGEAVTEQGKRFPILIAQRFGRGRTAIFATDGSWRWRMELDSSNHSHEFFWRQLLSSVVEDTPPFTSIETEKPLYADETRVRFHAQVHDENFEPVNGANAVATIHTPDGRSEELTLQHAVEEDGVFWGEWDAIEPGVYRVDLKATLGEKEIGTGTSFFQRADGILESFSSEQNVALLRRLAEETGGQYYPLEDAAALPEHLTYSPAGVSVPEVRDLWDMPIWLLLLLGLKGTEWTLRKSWKTV